MDLGLSLGDPSRSKSYTRKGTHTYNHTSLGFTISPHPDEDEGIQEGRGEREDDEILQRPSLQLHLLPFLPIPIQQHQQHQQQQQQQQSSTCLLPWPSSSDNINNHELMNKRGSDVNRPPNSSGDGGDDEDEAAVSSPNSTVSSFHMDFHMYNPGNRKEVSDPLNNDGDGERTSSRASDEDENGSTRKKLRLSKEQSAFLEESFKEHNTLNPKQKQALAKQLNLRPRQVEVWFQNRRARTKLKQTEVDCEYLKRCCDSLTEENRRLQKELQDLRALKTSSHPFYMQLPATTLTMCPSCERIASTAAADQNNNNNNNKATTTTTTTTTTTNAFNTTSTTTTTKPRFYSFSQQTAS